MEQINIFLVYAFSPESKAYTKAEIEAVLEEVCATARSGLHSSGYKTILNFDCYLTEYGDSLNSQLLKRLEETNIAIVDVSEKNLNVFYELGVIHGSKKKAILIQSSKVAIYLPSDLVGMLLLRYDRIQDIRGRLAREIERLSIEILKARSSSEGSLVDVWTLDESRDSNHICVVAPPTRREDSLPDKKYPDYCYIDLLGDKDSVLEVSVQIAKVYREANILRYTSKEFPKQNLRSPLVVVGGPGDGTPDSGNLLCKQISEYLNLPIGYSNDCELMVVNGAGEFCGIYDDEGYLVRDYGCIIRCKNPWQPQNRILLFHAIHTYGVLGAVLALSDSSVAPSNASRIVTRFGKDPLFYSFFQVEILNGAVTPPAIKDSNVFPLQ
jgi:hypothetical protein